MVYFATLFLLLNDKLDGSSYLYYKDPGKILLGLNLGLPPHEQAYY